MADDDLSAQIPYRRERTPSIVVQSLGLSFHKDSNITESVELADDESDDDGQNSNTANDLNDLPNSTGSGLDAQAASCDNLSSHDSTSSLHANISPGPNSPVRNLKGSLLFQSPAKPVASPGSGVASRRLSLNIGSTAPRRQSLTVDGLSSAFKDLPINASTGNATGSLRNKAILKPGHSLMGWIRLASTAKNLSGTNGKIIEVTQDELAKHNTENDCWVALKGNVYNVTVYLQYHPGGVEELMRGAGSDTTELFNEVHRWVNFESILAKCYVGPLKAESPNGRGGFVTMTVKSESPSKSSGVAPRASSPHRQDPTVANKPSRRQSIALTVPSPNKYQSLLVNNSSRPTQIQQPPTYVIFQDKSSIRLKIQDLHTLPLIRSRNVICDLYEEGKLQVSIILSPDWLYRIHMRFEQQVEKEPHANISNEEGTITIKLNKKESAIWNKIGTSLDLNDSLCEMTLADKFFRPCKLISKRKVTHDTYLMEFSSESSLMYVPIGWHVLIRSIADKPTSKNQSEDYRIHKNYTPVTQDILSNDGFTDESGFMMNSLCFIIKIYPNGVLTGTLNALKLGDCVEISNYQWVDFDIESLASSPRHWFLFCAGTGFTPMVRIMSYLLNNNDTEIPVKENVKSIHLVFFNKTQRDIIWRDKLEDVGRKFKTIFKVIHVLSDEPIKSDWSGERGLINKDLVARLVKKCADDGDDLSLLTCGSRTFTQLTRSIANDLNLSKSLYCFHG